METDTVKKYSKLKIVSALMTRSLWSHTKDWMQSNGDYYDLFMAAQYIADDHPMFWSVATALQQELKISGDELNAILEESEDPDLVS